MSAVMATSSHDLPPSPHIHHSSLWLYGCDCVREVSAAQVGGDQCVDDREDAIEAMREPTQAMIDAGRTGDVAYGYDRDCAMTWPDMIDAALKADHEAEAASDFRPQDTK